MHATWKYCAIAECIVTDSRQCRKNYDPMTFILSMRSGNSTCMGLIGVVDRHDRSKSKICSICSLYQALRSKGSLLYRNLRRIHSSGHLLRCPHLEIWHGRQQNRWLLYPFTHAHRVITLVLCALSRMSYTCWTTQYWCHKCWPSTYLSPYPPSIYMQSYNILILYTPKILPGVDCTNLDCGWLVSSSPLRDDSMTSRTFCSFHSI